MPENRNWSVKLKKYWLGVGIMCERNKGEREQSKEHWDAVRPRSIWMLHMCFQVCRREERMQV